MVSPGHTLQSSNSLRKSIASLAWFNASCMGRLLPTPNLRRCSALILRSAPTVNAQQDRTTGRASRRMGAASRFETAAFGGLLSMRPVEQHEADRTVSQSPVLRRLLLRVAASLSYHLQ